MVEKGGYRYPQLVFRRKRHTVQENQVVPTEAESIVKTYQEPKATQQEEMIMTEVQGQYSLFDREEQV